MLIYKVKLSLITFYKQMEITICIKLKLDLEIQNLDAFLEAGRQDQEQGSKDTKCKPLETNKQIRPNFCGNKRFLGVGGRRSVGKCSVKSAPGSTPTIQFSRKIYFNQIINFIFCLCTYKLH